MTDKDARDLIEQDLKEKLLGPGYAKEIIVCSPNCLDEIIPESPRNAYRVGIIMPGSASSEGQQDEEEIPDQNGVADEGEQIKPEIITESSEDANPAKDWSHEIEDADDSDTVTDSQSNPMSSHIGLITCVPSADEKIGIQISYGTYKRLSWKEQIKMVKIKTGKFSDSIEKAINTFSQNEKTKIYFLVKNEAEDEKGEKENDKKWKLADVSLKEIIVVNKDEQTISLSSSLDDKTKISLPSIHEFAPEGELIKTLFSTHYKRTHHSYVLKDIACNQPDQFIPLEEDKNLRLYVDSFEAKAKQFVKVILKSVTEQYIYQPSVEVTGNLVSYTEPVPEIDDDQENAINEFLYRKVCNYGKGVNCAVNWDKDARRIYTTFTPTVDVEKYTNVRKSADRQNITEACTLRNLSKWSEKEIIPLLRNFVNGYAVWHQSQTAAAEAIEGFSTEKETILGNQETLLKRLNENVDYLRDDSEALECFKIANTAMLMQMVVARHPLFKKNRDHAEYSEEPDYYDDLGFFKEAMYAENFGEPSYHPFQLAFLLMNVKQTFDLSDPSRKLVDLIWFPTGGGKTEAYLALTALTIVARRRRGQEKGVSVIMRYTLRLLTSQQFERATYLICALDFLRAKDSSLGLGKDHISIGLYVGKKVTPNTTDDLTVKNGKYTKYFNDKEDTDTLRNDNPFPITYCPWCGSRLVTPKGEHGYKENGGTFCLNRRCHFKANNNGLPLKYIDQNIYSAKPTLLFATVDKFAQLYSGKHAELLRPGGDIQSPDLIIQDELHLLVGALGSIVGFYESIIEKLCTKDGRFPKIIAATATTRNTSDLIKKLYNRPAVTFPPQGLEYRDNYFSFVEDGASKRRHMGLISAECVSSNMTEIRLTSLLILAKVKVFKKYIEDLRYDWLDPEDVKKACNKNGTLAKELDNYWSTVLYFNSLKDLGRSRSRVSQEIFEGVRSHQYLYSIPNSLSFLRPEKGFYQRVLEFTSRIDSSRIKSMLTKAETPVHLKDENDELHISSDSIDLVFASNMISVGIDIARWNLLVMVGQPRSTSEYIQSSSRAARSTYGLVVNLMNPRRIREHSLFENYVPFHLTFYKGVEPLSITPLTLATIKHPVLANIADIYKKQFMPRETDTDKIAKTIITDLFVHRYGLTRGQLVKELLEETKKTVEYLSDKEKAQSLREIAPDSYISINHVNYPKR